MSVKLAWMKKAFFVNSACPLGPNVSFKCGCSELEPTVCVVGNEHGLCASQFKRN